MTYLQNLDRFNVGNFIFTVKKMKNKKVFILLTSLMLVLTLSLSSSFFLKEASAAFLTTLSDTLSRIEDNTAANHTIEFVTPTGVDQTTDTIIIAFDDTGDAYNLTGLTYQDVDLAIDNDGNCDGTWTDKTLGSTAASGVWGVNINTTNDQITFTAPSNATTGEITAGYCVQIEIGTNATSGATGTNQIVNPSSGTYVTAISGTFGDTGRFAVAIVADDQIDITAQVDPTLTVTISADSCALGTLTANFIETCNYLVTVSTNATNGYVSTIVADGLLRNLTDDINDATDGTVNKGSEEYGVGTSKAGQTILQNTLCTDHDAGVSQPASQLLTSAQQFANATGPISADATTVCHLASVSGATPAGSYAQVATIIVTANF